MFHESQKISWIGAEHHVCHTSHRYLLYKQTSTFFTRFSQNFSWKCDYCQKCHYFLDGYACIEFNKFQFASIFMNWCNSLMPESIPPAISLFYHFILKYFFGNQCFIISMYVTLEVCGFLDIGHL